jgi:hypothetical protein
MGRRLNPVAAFIVGGFLANAFAGFINPIYITQILANLDGRVIILGSMVSSAFPVLVGLVLERRAVFERLYALMPLVMLVELALTSFSTLLLSVDLGAFYLLSMLVFGVLTNSVLFLQHRLKEVTVRRNRAAFDRRLAVADGLGYLAGSALGLVGSTASFGPTLVGVLGVAQTAAVYGLLVFVYRKVPHRRRRRAAEQEPHPCQHPSWCDRPDSAPCLLAA